MRHPLLLTGVLLLMPAAALAQVTIDLRALEALPQAPSPPRRPAPRAVLRTVPAGSAASSPVTTGPAETGGAATAALPVPPIPPSNATPGVPPNAIPGVTTGGAGVAGAGQAPAGGPASTGQATASAGLATPAGPATPAAPAPPTAPATRAPPAATLPAAPPAVASLAPIPQPVAPSTAAPPALPPVSATAGTTATPQNTGLRLVFKPDESDLSPAANGAIGELVKATPAGDTVTYNVVAYAAGVADDPSAARRTSLARGLSVRAALIAAGVPSTRIYVRALGAASGGAAGGGGASGGDGPPDRVDMTVLGASGATAAAAPKP
jgi:outer membrane protein OmpA-like peptidoglycan-associated protein